MNKPFRIMRDEYNNKFLIEWVAIQCHISLDIGFVLPVFGSSYGLTQIQHKLVQYPVILDGYPSNNIICIGRHASWIGLFNSKVLPTNESHRNRNMGRKDLWVVV